MTTPGELIFDKNVTRVRHEIGGPDIDPAFAARVEIVRDCLATRRPPTYHRRRWLERHDAALLAYLDEVSDTGAWRTLLNRVRETPPIDGGSRVWLCRIAQSVLDLADIGQAILDRNAGAEHQAALTVIPVAASGESGDGGTGDAGNGGQAGTVATPTPAPQSAAAASRLRIPLSDVERRELGLRKDSEAEDKTPDATDTDGLDGTGGPDGPDVTRGPKP
jgi:hypothetical protein